MVYNKPVFLASCFKTTSRTAYRLFLGKRQLSSIAPKAGGGNLPLETPREERELLLQLLPMFNQVCKHNIRCLALLWCHLFGGSKWNLFRLPCSSPSRAHVRLPCFLHFSSVEPCTLFSLLHSDGGVNAVRLLLGFQRDYFKWYYFHLWRASPAVLTFEANSKQTSKSAGCRSSRASPLKSQGATGL